MKKHEHKTRAKKVDITKLSTQSNAYRFTSWCVRHRWGLLIWGILTALFGIGEILIMLSIFGFLAKDENDD